MYVHASTAHAVRGTRLEYARAVLRRHALHRALRQQLAQLGQHHRQRAAQQGRPAGLRGRRRLVRRGRLIRLRAGRLYGR